MWRQVESGQIKDVLPSAESLNDRLAALTSREDVMVFIKGTPDAPRCGFSRTLVQMFGDIDGLDYGYYDILGDEEVRQGLKKYSDWPTYPQVYKKGELLGGLDILKVPYAAVPAHAYRAPQFCPRLFLPRAHSTRRYHRHTLVLSRLPGSLAGFDAALPWPW